MPWRFIEDDDGEDICEIFATGSIAHQQERARLIAAAPELLEALKETIVAFDEVRATYLSGGSAALTAARALIRRIEAGP
jgi:hypothetical protein